MAKLYWLSDTEWARIGRSERGHSSRTAEHSCTVKVTHLLDGGGNPPPRWKGTTSGPEHLQQECYVITSSARGEQRWRNDEPP